MNDKWLTIMIVIIMSIMVGGASINGYIKNQEAISKASSGLEECPLEKSKDIRKIQTIRVKDYVKFINQRMGYEYSIPKKKN